MSAWRVVILTVLPAVAQRYAEIVARAGHETVAIVTPRRVRSDMPVLPFASSHVEGDPDDVDIVFAASKRSLARLLRAYEADLALCFAFPWLIPADAIEAPPLGIVNAHPSPLPRYRGPFPTAWQVRNREPEIALSYHLMDATFDTGNLLAQKSIPLDPEETNPSLSVKVDAAAAELLPVVFEKLARGNRGDVQSGGDYQSIFEDAYWVIDPAASTAADVHLQVRSWSFMPPIPGLGPFLDRGERVKVLRTSMTEVEGAERLECTDGPLWVLETEPA